MDWADGFDSLHNHIHITMRIISKSTTATNVTHFFYFSRLIMNYIIIINLTNYMIKLQFSFHWEKKIFHTFFLKISDKNAIAYSWRHLWQKNENNFFPRPGCAKELKLRPFDSKSKTRSGCSNSSFSKKITPNSLFSFYQFSIEDS